MQRVIVSVKRLGEGAEQDLELPAEVEAVRLGEMVAQALGWELSYAGQQIVYKIEAHPLGRALAPEESLADALVWDGSWLVLYPTGVSAPEQIEPAAQAVELEAMEVVQEDMVSGVPEVGGQGSGVGEAMGAV